jgi:acyl carrier protein
VRHAAVRPFEGEDGRIESLVAYVVTGEAHDLDAKALRTHLGDYLPSSVVPGRYVEVPEMPRSAAGKIDRDGLPDPETHVRTIEDDHLQTSAERLIASIWRDVLDLDTVTRHGNFFEFGGNSLAAVKVHRRLQRQFDKEIELVHLFEHTTVAQLADFLDEPGDSAEEAESPQAERGRTRRNRLQKQQRRRSDQGD